MIVSGMVGIHQGVRLVLLMGYKRGHKKSGDGEPSPQEVMPRKTHRDQSSSLLGRLVGPV
jgi:hypothetical protein